jgi:NAD(P)-dependent dehydrogenase (short-subunit alcohol dehydrogenase family)
VIDLRQKSIVVTGGASGIGAAICTAAYEEGAVLVSLILMVMLP